MQHMPSVYKKVKFFWLDCDSSSDLIDVFNVDQVPAVVIVHPHKINVEIVNEVSPESLVSLAEQ